MVIMKIGDGDWQQIDDLKQGMSVCIRLYISRPTKAMSPSRVLGTGFIVMENFGMLTCAGDFWYANVRRFWYPNSEIQLSLFVELVSPSVLLRGGFVELYVERVQDADQGLQKVALESISELFTDYFHLHFSPDDTPWDGGTFKLALQFSEDYPIYADGSICLDILQNQWSPIYDVVAILTSIQEP
ncbi:hypothetical protein L2E82_31467 [Cichorium intybus]|uniref:Uncharacterized protein n=1 Tax=Cichorium intybus TaxID=13427 RepID=A0ACB9D3G1_CICIN|nr:hypothetical protein L2E82_31467 [Cichorium intybus]